MVRTNIRREFADPARIVGQYPAAGWQATLERTPAGVRLRVQGPVSNRLLVLE